MRAAGNFVLLKRRINAKSPMLIETINRCAESNQHSAGAGLLDCSRATRMFVLKGYDVVGAGIGAVVLHNLGAWVGMGRFDKAI